MPNKDGITLAVIESNSCFFFKNIVDDFQTYWYSFINSYYNTLT